MSNKNHTRLELAMKAITESTLVTKINGVRASLRDYFNIPLVSANIFIIQDMLFDLFNIKAHSASLDIDVPVANRSLDCGRSGAVLLILMNKYRNFLNKFKVVKVSLSIVQKILNILYILDVTATIVYTLLDFINKVIFRILFNYIPSEETTNDFSWWRKADLLFRNMRHSQPLNGVSLFIGYKHFLPALSETTSLKVLNIYEHVDKEAVTVEKSITTFLNTPEELGYNTYAIHARSKTNIDVVFTFSTILFNSVHIHSKSYHDVENIFTTIIPDIQKTILTKLTKDLLKVKEASIGNFDIKESKMYTLATEPLNDTEYYDIKTYESLKTVAGNALKKDIKLNVLLYGHPGLGKTSSIRKLIKELNILKIKVDHDMYKGIIPVIKNINHKKLLLIDDMDIEENFTKTKESTKLLDLLDSDCYDIAIMTSNSNKLYPALVRSGRVDLVIKCELPTAEEIEDMLNNITTKTNLYNLGMYASITDMKNDVRKVSRMTSEELGCLYTHAVIMNINKLSLLYKCSLSESIEKIKQSNKNLKE